jgi:colicin import membrane protein
MENGLAIIDLGEITAIQLFAPGQLEASVGQIERETRDKLSKLDISTAKGREAIASLNHYVARSKTFIDGKRKELVADEKRRLAAIDAEGKVYWNRLESLQKEVTRELDAWKEADSKRCALLEYKVSKMAELGSVGHGATTYEIECRIAEVDALDMSNMQEFTSRAELAESQTRKALATALEESQQRDAEKSENERLRKEAAEREQKERDERIAKEAREKAQREAEEERHRIEQEKFAAEARAKQAEAARVESERLAEERRVAAEARAKQDAEEAEKRHNEAVAAAAKKAEDDRIAFEAAEKRRAEIAEAQRKEAEERHARDLQEQKERAEREAKVAEERRQREAKEAADRAERDRVAALEAERERVAAEARKVAAETEARERDKKHKSAVMGAAKDALIAAGIPEEHAKAAVLAIQRGQVPAVRIEF